MSLQDWFYVLAIIYMVLGIVTLLGIIWLTIYVAEQVQKLKREAEIRALKLELALKNFTRPHGGGALALIPWGWRFIRRIFK